MAYTPPSGINLQHLLALIGNRRPTMPTSSGIAGQLGHAEQVGHQLISQQGVSPAQRTMPAAVLFAHGPGNQGASEGEQYAPVNAGAVAAGTAAPLYGGMPEQTGPEQGMSPLSPLLHALAQQPPVAPRGGHSPRANPNIYGDHGYTHAVPSGGIHATHDNSPSTVPRSGFYTPANAPAWLRNFMARQGGAHGGWRPV